MIEPRTATKRCGVLFFGLTTSTMPLPAFRALNVRVGQLLDLHQREIDSYRQTKNTKIYISKNNRQNYFMLNKWMRGQ